MKIGITPRAIEEMFYLLNSNLKHRSCEINVSCHMVELYMDTLYDPLATKEQKKINTHLEIKEDPRGMVYVQGISVSPLMISFSKYYNKES